MATFRKYKHVGVNDIVLDGTDGEQRRISPGEIFYAVITPELERFFLEIGAVESLPDVDITPDVESGETGEPRKAKKK